jgi:hypothetical protein
LDRACSRNGRQDRGIQGFGDETWGEEEHLKDPGVYERIILKWILEKSDGENGLDPSGGNVVTNLRIPQNAGNFLSSRKPVSFSGRIPLHGVRILNEI